MLRFYFLRHGETVFNTQEIVQGWNDSDLTSKGIDQARFAGYGAKEVMFTAAYCGDTGRQIDTARYFMDENDHPVSVIPDPHFREMNYGKYEGGTYEEMLGPLFRMKNDVYSGYAGLYRHYTDIEIAEYLLKSDETGRLEGSQKVYERVREGIDEIIGRYDEGNILISTSSFAICAFLYGLFPEFRQPTLVDNASISIVGYDDAFHLIDYNDISYREKGEMHYLKRSV